VWRFLGRRHRLYGRSVSPTPGTNNWCAGESCRTCTRPTTNLMIAEGLTLFVGSRVENTSDGWEGMSSSLPCVSSLNRRRESCRFPDLGKPRAVAFVGGGRHPILSRAKADCI